MLLRGWMLQDEVSVFSLFLMKGVKTKNILVLLFSSNFGRNRRMQDKWRRFLRHLWIWHGWRCDYVIMASSLVCSCMTSESKCWAVWNVTTLRSLHHEIMLFNQRVWVWDGKTGEAQRFRRKNALRFQRLQRLRFSKSLKNQCIVAPKQSRKFYKSFEFRWSCNCI